jgi:hypothetical protein
MELTLLVWIVGWTVLIVVVYLIIKALYLISRELRTGSERVALALTYIGDRLERTE